MFENATILLTPDEMTAADAAAAASGLNSFDLMDRAGRAVAAAALAAYPGALRHVVLCGPGNNGGDGYVAARALYESGVPVAAFALGDRADLKGDALRAFDLCPVAVWPLSEFTPEKGDIIIDALFGAGLSRAVPDAVAEVMDRVFEARLPVLAIDLPSGLCGRRGMVLGRSFRAERTVTFMAKKPGHLLMPGRELCGQVDVFDIGIPGRIITACAGIIGVNTPSAWASHLPQVTGESHKYRRGHLGVFSGGAWQTGAARLSAEAALTTGAGLVTIGAPGDALGTQAATLTAIMLRQVDDAASLDAWLQSGKLSAFVIGPGFGIGDRACRFVEQIANRPVVLDADAITSFAPQPDALFNLFREGELRLVMTPHEGEFGRLFADLAADRMLGKVEKAQAAAARSHAVIVYKGADTVIAAPDGRALINVHAPADLATAGSGDVLAGMIGALMAQGMPAFEAAAAGVWLHGEAGFHARRGLTAETLITHIPSALSALYSLISA
ncbi:NAD(P)H-hydrate dehydratase [Rhizobium sp. FY34]|uniref:NAD(P)H-hydrate dehydratase n=1 Tax=Rhizobium sp. FY34 TaxID=2562309 RepID=UPI0010C01AF6|nr:NAD(P)H-hydrate dehydratase [Rhizobium sp. FY34]